MAMLTTSRDCSLVMIGLYGPVEAATPASWIDSAGKIYFPPSTALRPLTATRLLQK
jgi:hypothetical protein